MNKIKKIIFCFLLSISLLSFSSNSLAQITVPKPFVDFSGIFVDFEPICINGALVVVVTPIPLLLLYPYVPISPIVPVFKLWGPIPGATTEGAFLPGGVCLLPSPTGPIPIPVFGTLIQIGTTAGPTPFVPIFI